MISVFRWWNTSNVEVILPTTQQLNEMVGREGAPSVPLPNTPSGN